MNLKFSNQLTIHDFKEFPVWEFTGKHEGAGPNSELVVEPVTNLPVTTLEGRFVGSELTLANGHKVLAVLIGVDLKKAKPISAAIFYNGEEKFMFRRSAPRLSGGEQLAKFLGLPVKDIFPIAFDISKIAIGDANSVNGEISLDLPPSLAVKKDKEYFKQLLKEKTSKP